MPIMGNQVPPRDSGSQKDVPDSAAILAIAVSLWQMLGGLGTGEGHGRLNLSECYNGMDQLMREVMNIANTFESWACEHVAFEELNDVWPYLLENKFAEACLAIIEPVALQRFDETYCLRVAMHLRLPLIYREGLPLPVEFTTANPVANSGFHMFRIQTVRVSIEDDFLSPFTFGDDPFDGEFLPPHFALYGVGNDGSPEHIADRRFYAEIVSLAKNIAPGIRFPEPPFAVVENSQ